MVVVQTLNLDLQRILRLKYVLFSEAAITTTESTEESTTTGKTA